MFETRNPEWPERLVASLWQRGFASEEILLHDGHLLTANTGGVTIYDLRQLDAAPWAYAEAARLRAPGALDIAVYHAYVYVAQGEDGVAVFQSDVDWASEPDLPTPTPFLLTPPPPSSTPSPPPCATATPPGIPTEVTPTPTLETTPRETRPAAGLGVVYLPMTRR
jgi:hypothetical protein